MKRLVGDDMENMAYDTRTNSEDLTAKIVSNNVKQKIFVLVMVLVLELALVSVLASVLLLVRDSAVRRYAIS